MIQLKKGDPCRVRLHTGEVVDAVYEMPSCVTKSHLVSFKGGLYRAASFPGHGLECRFVGPNCDIQEIKHGTN